MRGSPDNPLGMVGKTIDSKSFFSTSFDEDMAKSFMDRADKTQKSTLLKIRARKGHPCAYPEGRIANVEAEVLFHNTRFKVTKESNIYFITSTIHCWVPIIYNDDIFSIILDSLKFCKRNKGLDIYGYVIMPNHIHAIIGHDDYRKIPFVIKDFKRHTSKQVSNYIKEECRLNSMFWIKIFKESSNKSKVWQEGYHPVGVISEGFFIDKFSSIIAN